MFNERPEVKPCPLSGLRPWPRRTTNGTYYYVCSLGCKHNISESPGSYGICDHEKCRHPYIGATKPHAYKYDAIVEWNNKIDGLENPKESRPETEPGSNDQTCTIDLRLSCFAPSIKMTITIPDERDNAEYIDELLSSMLAEEFRFNTEWHFID